MKTRQYKGATIEISEGGLCYIKYASVTAGPYLSVSAAQSVINDAIVKANRRACLNYYRTLPDDISVLSGAGSPLSPDYSPAPISFRSVSYTKISEFTTNHGFTKPSSAGTAADDPTEQYDGHQSIKLTTPGTANGPVFIDKRGTWDFSNVQFKIAVKAEDYTKLSGLWLQLGTRDINVDNINIDMARDLRTLRNGEWNIITVNLAETRSKTGNPDLSNINILRLRANGTDKGQTSVWFGYVGTFPAESAGVASVVFDDGYDSDFTTAYPVMKAAGVNKGVSYIIADKIGTNKRMTLDNLKELERNGWDISSHGTPDLTTLSEQQLNDEFKAIKKFIYDNGLNRRAADHYALPMGRYNPLVQKVAAKYFNSVRTIDVNHETIVPGDRMRLRVLYCIASTTEQQFRKWVDDCKANKSWAIFVFHRVDEVTDGAPESVTKANFQKFMAYLGQSGLAVKTVREVIEQ